MKSKLIVGKDNVDSWKDQTIWDSLLEYDVIVSTPAILRDALNHGFFNIDHLSLLVVDEGTRA